MGIIGLSVFDKNATAVVLEVTAIEDIRLLLEQLSKD